MPALTRLSSTRTDASCGRHRTIKLYDSLNVDGDGKLWSFFDLQTVCTDVPPQLARSSAHLLQDQPQVHPPPTRPDNSLLEPTGGTHTHSLGRAFCAAGARGRAARGAAAPPADPR